MLGAVFATQILAPTPALSRSPGHDKRASHETYDGFSELRHKVLDFIAGAGRRVWLATDYLTDGEIATALYVARYRKLDVRVLLGRSKSRAYMSRLNYLKNQNIPVHLQPSSFEMKAPTGILADDRVMYVDAELNFLAKHGKFTAKVTSGKRAQQFASHFAKAAGEKVSAVPRPVPKVGRARKHKTDNGQQKRTRSRSGTRLPKRTPKYDRSEPGVYHYDKKARPAPTGVPDELPDTTIWKENQRRRSGPDSRSTDVPSSPDTRTRTRSHSSGE